MGMARRRRHIGPTVDVGNCIWFLDICQKKISSSSDTQTAKNWIRRRRHWYEHMSRSLFHTKAFANFFLTCCDFFFFFFGNRKSSYLTQRWSNDIFAATWLLMNDVLLWVHHDNQTRDLKWFYNTIWMIERWFLHKALRSRLPFREISLFQCSSRCTSCLNGFSITFPFSL